jgi:hypothetical protein
MYLCRDIPELKTDFVTSVMTSFYPVFFYLCRDIPELKADCLTASCLDAPHALPPSQIIFGIARRTNITVFGGGGGGSGGGGNTGGGGEVASIDTTSTVRGYGPFASRIKVNGFSYYAVRFCHLHAIPEVFSNMQ